MSTTASRRLTDVFNAAKVIDFDDSSRFILFGDCHRGDNSWADDFAQNQTLFFHALTYYYNEGFTYIEIGDADELWENRNFADVRRAHSHVFWLMRQFHQAGRLHMVWGNHDIERQDPNRVKETLYRYYDERTGQYEPLFDGIQLQEGIALRYADTGDKILLAHGHQADPINDRWWRLGRFFVRYFWRQLQLIGVRDLTSPAQNFKKQGEVEGRLVAWVEDNQQVLIAGHTHRSRFPDENSPPYFNTGSCVHPRCVTGIEIQDGQIALIKWSIRPNDAGLLYVARDILVGPKDLNRFFL